MKTIADPDVLRSLMARLGHLTPECERRWGTLTAHEMVCHLGDAVEMVIGVRPREAPLPRRRRAIVKAIGLWTAMRWPHGWRTNPAHDPRLDGTRPTAFDADVARLLRALEALANVDDGLEPMHGVFGVMSRSDWQRWAYKHVDHHLRQFGL